MENIIYNELIIRDCTVDIWVVYSNEKNRLGKVSQVAREIDFIANSGGKKTYIQSAYALGTEEKTITENKPFSLTGDSFPKIIVRHDIRKRWYDENGVLNIGIIDFLLDDTVIWPSKPESNPVQLQEWDCYLEYIPLKKQEKGLESISTLIWWRCEKAWCYRRYSKIILLNIRFPKSLWSFRVQISPNKKVPRPSQENFCFRRLFRPAQPKIMLFFPDDW